MSYDIKQIFEDEVSNFEKEEHFDNDTFLKEALGIENFDKFRE